MTQHGHDGNSISPAVEAHELTTATEYWTEERRRTAKPVPMPKEHAKPETESVAPTPAGKPGETKHGFGSEKDASHDAEGLGATVVNPLAYPYRTIGKIFFTQGGAAYSASASMVAPNVLLTAGHCVYGGGQWSSNMVFYPSYGKRANTDPANHFVCGRMSVRTSYITNGNKAHDYALVWMGQTPGNIIGWLGLAWNLPTAGRTWEAVGYPATPNPPFNGSTMASCVGTYAPSATPGTFGLTNDNMEHGSSGGPWITAVNETVRSHANGLQSFHLHDGDTIEYGPYFTDEVKTLLDYISNPANH